MTESGIPDKLFFKIGEVAELASLRPSVLRYWETEFSVLKPHKSRTGQRLYSRKDLELVLEIKTLLYVEKLTIEGARKRISSNGVRGYIQQKGAGGVSRETVFSVLSEVRAELERFRDSL